MSVPTPAWQAPEPEPGPGAGIAFASPGSRLIAYILDLVIQFLIVLVLGVLTAHPRRRSSSRSRSSRRWRSSRSSFGYFPYFWSRNGQTPGMSQMKIKVVRDKDGGPVTVGSAILRFIGLLIGLSVFYIGVIWIFIDKRKRGWQDLIGGTVVVDVPPAEYVS